MTEIIRRGLLSLLLLTIVACSSVPQGQRVAASEGFELGGARIAVLDASASIGTLDGDGDFLPDQALSDRVGGAMQDAIVAAARERGLSAERLVLMGEPASAEAVLALEDRYDAVHEEGFADRSASLAATSPRFAEALRADIDADYALVPIVSGAYSSGGRRLSQVAGAALAVGLGVGYVHLGGGQYAVLGLYDLREERIVWVHKDAFGKPSLRNMDGLEGLAADLLAPLPVRR